MARLAEGKLILARADERNLIDLLLDLLKGKHWDETCSRIEKSLFVWLLPFRDSVDQIQAKAKQLDIQFTPIVTDNPNGYREFCSTKGMNPDQKAAAYTNFGQQLRERRSKLVYAIGRRIGLADEEIKSHFPHAIMQDSDFGVSEKVELLIETAKEHHKLIKVLMAFMQEMKNASRTS